MEAFNAPDGAYLGAQHVVPLYGIERARYTIVGLREALHALGHLLFVLGAESRGLVPSVGGSDDGAVEQGGGHSLLGFGVAAVRVEALAAVIWRDAVVSLASVFDDVAVGYHAGEREEEEGVGGEEWEGGSHGNQEQSGHAFDLFLWVDDSGLHGGDVIFI